MGEDIATQTPVDQIFRTPDRDTRSRREDVEAICFFNDAWVMNLTDVTLKLRGREGRNCQKNPEKKKRRPELASVHDWLRSVPRDFCEKFFSLDKIYLDFTLISSVNEQNLLLIREALHNDNWDWFAFAV